MNALTNPNRFTSFFRRMVSKNGHAFSPLAIAGMVVGGLLLVGLLIVLFTFLIQWLWGWLIPDLFPAAIRNGTLAASISWLTAFKILIALSIIGGLLRGGSSSMTHSNEAKKTRTIENAPIKPEQTNIAGVAPRVFPDLVDPLTDRELEVLQFLAKGMTNQQIAAQLNISESTAVYHIGHIFGKLRVNSRVEAAVWAKERGII